MERGAEWSLDAVDRGCRCDAPTEVASRALEKGNWRIEGEPMGAFVMLGRCGWREGCVGADGRDCLQ